MICVLRISDDKQITGWMIAADVPEARRRAHAIGDSALAEDLDQQATTPPSGKYELPGGHVLLVD